MQHADVETVLALVVLGVIALGIVRLWRDAKHANKPVDGGSAVGGGEKNGNDSQ